MVIPHLAHPLLLSTTDTIVVAGIPAATHTYINYNNVNASFSKTVRFSIDTHTQTYRWLLKVQLLHVDQE